MSNLEVWASRFVIWFCCVEKLLTRDIKVVLEDAKTAEKPAITPSPESPSLTAEELEKKLQEVEDRRKSLEAATLERLAEAEKRAEEVTIQLW